MAVSFVRSWGSWSHRGAAWKQQHARPEKVPLRTGTICTWSLSTERGFTAPAKWKSHSTYRQLCQVTSGLSDLTVVRVLAFETILISPLVQLRQTWRGPHSTTLEKLCQFGCFSFICNQIFCFCNSILFMAFMSQLQDFYLHFGLHGPRWKILSC